ncbi:Ribonucleoside-diphosphate reductase large subunit [uncultured virus]|nr:Ribonucleoside-diphosphate reductase large subunit [uncultured virus]
MEPADITRGLNVDAKIVQDALLGEYSSERFKAAALKVAGDLSTYDNMRLGGRMLIYDATRPCGTLTDYVDFMEHRLNKRTAAFISEHVETLEAEVLKHIAGDYEHHDLFSASTLIKTYLMRPTYGEEPWETPQQMFIRVAVQTHYRNGIARVVQCYRELSEAYYTPASPTLFNAGTIRPQMSSCFLVGIKDDLESILYTGVGDSGMISRLNGGLGINANNLRHSMIGDVGMSSGIIPALRVYDKTVKYVDQGGKRDGACTVFLRPHHIDVKDFVEATDNFKDHQFRFSTLNTCLWMSRLFFKRVEQKGKWTVFCPAKAKLLNTLYGYEFDAEYLRMEGQAAKAETAFTVASRIAVLLRAKKMADPKNRELNAQYKKALQDVVLARKARVEHIVYMAEVLYDGMVDIQTRSGMPYIMHGDTANYKSNQKNLGPTDQSNLCLEVIERANAANPDGIPSCNLSSLNMSAFAKGVVTVDVNDGKFFDQLRAAYDFKLYGQMTQSVVQNLEEIIDLNYYPLDEHKTDEKGATTIKRGKISSLNFDMRPLGVGVSGFSDAAYLMDLGFEDPRTEQWNKLAFACQYFNGIVASLRLSIERGEYKEFRTGSYKRYQGVKVVEGVKTPVFEEVKGSPMANGQFQFDLWAEEAQMLADMGDLDEKIYNRADDKPVDPKQWGQEPIEFTTQNANGETVTIRVEPTWECLRQLVMRYGMRHSLLFALMPTASTAQIFRNTESTEAPQANLYSRQVISGNYTVLNRHLEKDLTELKCWTPNLIQFLAACKGTIKWLIHYIEDHPTEFRHVFEEKTRWEEITVSASPDTGATSVEIEDKGIKYTIKLDTPYDSTNERVTGKQPEFKVTVERFTMKTPVAARLTWLVAKYKTMYEISQKTNIRYSAQRGRYICQSQSLNIYMKDPKKVQMRAIHSYTNKIGVKTGMYYLRQDPGKFCGDFNLHPSIMRYHIDLMRRVAPSEFPPVKLELKASGETKAMSPGAAGYTHPQASPRELTVMVPPVTLIRAISEGTNAIQDDVCTKEKRDAGCLACQ